MARVLFLPLNQNHVIIFESIIRALRSEYKVLCHDKISEGLQYYTEKMLQKYNLNYQHFNKEISVSPEDIFFKKVINFFRISSQMKSLFDEIEPNALVLAIDNDPIAQIAIREAKIRNIKTVLVPEGLIKPYEFINKIQYFSDYLYRIFRYFGIYLSYIPLGSGGCYRHLVSGKIAFDIFKSVGVDDKRMIIVGQQKYDSFITKVKNHNPPINNPKIYLYAASTRIFVNDEEKNFVKKLYNASQGLGLKLIIKLHPRTIENVDELYKQIGSSKTPLFDIIKEGYETFELLSIVDAVVTISSAIVLEALLMNKECIAVNYLAGRRRYGYESYDAIFSIEREEMISSVIKDSLESPKPYLNKKKLLEDELYQLDGQASFRTAEIIENLIANR